MDSFEILLEPQADPIDFRALPQIEDGRKYLVENVGSMRADYRVGGPRPSGRRRGHRLLPRGDSNPRIFEPLDRPIWLWNAESVKTAVMVSLSV